MNQLDPHSAGNIPGGRKLRLDKANGKLAGICAGLADYFGMDPVIMRLIFVLGTVIGLGSFILVYLAVWLLAV